MAERTTETDYAWAAGLFEGEGSFGWQHTDGRRYPRAYLAMTDSDVLHRFAEVVGVGRIYAVNRRVMPSHWKPIEAWVACGIKNVRRVGDVVGPYLGERRSAKLAELLEWQPAPPRVRRDYCSEPVEASSAGRNAHVSRGEEPCERCRLSRNLYARHWRSLAR